MSIYAMLGEMTTVTNTLLLPEQEVGRGFGRRFGGSRTGSATECSSVMT